MGPNSIRLLDKLIRRNPYEACCGRTPDLGCDMALTSVFLANETSAKSVYAFDLRINATDNLKRIRDFSLEDRIAPVCRLCHAVFYFPGNPPFFRVRIKPVMFFSVSSGYLNPQFPATDSAVRCHSSVTASYAFHICSYSAAG